MRDLFGVLLLVGFVCVHWHWLLAGVVLVLIVRAAPVAWRELQAKQDRRRAAAEALVARANQQHRWAMRGDPRGTFGNFPPAAT